MAGREKPRPGVADVMRTTCDAMQSVDRSWAEDEIVGDVGQMLGLWVDAGGVRFVTKMMVQKVVIV